MFDLTSTLPIVSAVSTISLVAFLAYREAKSGNKEITTQVIQNYATLDKQQKDNIQECRDNLTGATEAMHKLELRTNERIANLEGVVSEKDKSIALLMQTLANRNPDLETTLVDVRNFMKNINDLAFAKADGKILKKPRKVRVSV